MRNYLERLCDELDASVFSGDGFHNKEALERLKHYVGRWSRESEKIEEMLIEIEPEKNEPESTTKNKTNERNEIKFLKGNEIQFLRGELTGGSFASNALEWAIKELKLYNLIIETERKSSKPDLKLAKEYKQEKKELLKIIAAEPCQQIIKDVLILMQQQLDFPPCKLSSNPWMAVPSKPRHKRGMENYLKLSKGEV